MAVMLRACPPRCALATLLALVLLAQPSCGSARSGDDSDAITVFAAASTSDVMTEAARRFEASTGISVVCSFDASSSLSRQITLGAPADVFLSANQEWMDELEAAGVLVPGSRQDMLANELVLVAAPGAELDVEWTAETDFASQLPGVKRLAMGDPAHVPAGRYAMQALESLGWWDEVEPHVIPAVDVRAALRLVEIGEADLGFVYASDVRASPDVRVIAVVPSALHDPIVYPVARCSSSPAGAAFVAFLRSEEMASVFADAGFHVLRDGPDEEP